MQGSVSIVAMEGDSAVPRFEIHAYRGGPLRVAGFAYPVIVDLETASFEGTEQTYINRHHDQKRELGHSTDRRIDATGIHVEGIFSHDNEDTREIITAWKRGKKFKASIEASFPPARFVPRGQTVMVNGTRHPGPVYVAKNSRITGVALLTRAADMDSDVRIAAARKVDMNEDLREFIEAAGFDADVISESETQIEFFKAQFEASRKPAKKSPEKQDLDAAGSIDWHDIQKKSQQIAAAEAERQSEIRSICLTHGDPEIELPDGSKCTLVAHAIRSGMTAKECLLEAKLFQVSLKAGGNAPAVHMRTSEDEPQVIECAMLLSGTSVSEEDLKKSRWYSEQVIDKATSSQYRGYRFSRLAHQTMQAANVYHPPGQLDDNYIEATVKAVRKLEATGSSFTTLSLPGIMKSVVNKTVLAAYRRGESIVPFIFGRTSTTDFKPTLTYRLEGSGMLEKLPPDGEIKHGKLVESEYTKQLETYAKMLAFTRRDLINDDLGQLQNVAAILGQMAWKAREFAAVQLITSSTMYSAQNGNLLNGNNLSIAGLTASTLAFESQVDADGLPITISGTRILTPAALRVVLMQLQNQTEIRDTSSTFINNPHAGTFVGLASPWLDNALATNNDPNRAKTWYRFADPDMTPAFQIMYLNGNDEPIVNSAETDFNTLGMQWRCYTDWGMGEVDPKYAQKNVGS